MTGKPISDYVSIKGRFARSVRLDNDAGHADRLDGYLPTGRSLEVVRRVVGAMAHADGTRAFSITGPYGSGKSSLALFIDALLGPTDDAVYVTALRILRGFDADAARQIIHARQNLGAGATGFIRAIVTTPEREPITTTVLRALNRGAVRAKVANDLRRRVANALERAESERYAAPSSREIKALCRELTERKPLLLVIDEFGKNLEAYADGGREGDLYLLQELAEWATGADPLPLILITIQHLAFEAYANDATSAQRREWAKVQGRLEDIPFVDSGATSRSLIAAAIQHSTSQRYRRIRDSASREMVDSAEELGLAGIASPELVAACYPLHPAVLLVLPDLCARYGQNERTLFSFLSSQEPNSVMSFARTTALTNPPSWVHLDDIYDYFVQSAAGFVGTSQDASRWIEIETTIRDAHGLSDLQQQVLKTVGVLNLISSGGMLRASPEMIVFAFSGRERRDQLLTTLSELEHTGLLTFRDFAAEYRVWRGSDFDLGSALRSARRQVRQQSLARVLDSVQPMRPLIASRHSIQSGTTRAFARMYADRHSQIPNIDGRYDRADAESRERFNGTDGLVVFVVDPKGDPPAIQPPASGLPIVVVVPTDPQPVLEAATEVGALLHIAEDPSLPSDDRVARRELTERTAYARQVLDSALADAFSDEARWTWINAPTETDSTSPRTTPSRYLSDVLDSVFADSPGIANETINRTELTSQGARARRDLLEALLTPSRRRLQRLGLAGDGPEVSIYRAVLEDSGIHNPRPEAVLSTDTCLDGPLKPAWIPVWSELSSWLRLADGAPVSVSHLFNRLSEPPFGIKAGPAAILFTAALVAHATEIAVYEHGTFSPRLDSPFVERMVKNPENFAIKHLASGKGTQRWQAVEQIGLALRVELPTSTAAAAAAARPTVLTVIRALVDVLQRHGDRYTHRTKEFNRLWDSDVDSKMVMHARRVRDVLLESHEPDVVLFEALPAALGFGPLPASGRGNSAMDNHEIPEYAELLATAVATIDQAQGRLSDHLVQTICEAAGCNTLEEAVSRARELEEIEVLTDDVRRFARIASMRDLYPDHVSWLSAVTETICSSSLGQWTDETALGHVERLRQVATDYARVANLARFAAGRYDEAFRAYQLHITGQDGSSSSEIVTIPERLVADFDGVLETAIRMIATSLDADTGTAREAILAWLAADRLGYRKTQVSREEETSAQREAASNDG